MKVFILVMLLGAFSASAQDNVRLTDDQYNVLRKDILENYSKHPLDAISRASEYLRKYDVQFSPRQKLRMYYTKAYFQIQGETFADAFATLAICKRLADEVNDLNLTFYYHGYMAGMLNTLENYELSLESYFLALSVAKQTNDESMVARTYNNLGNVLTNLGRYDNAQPYIEKFYHYGKETNNWSYISTALNNLGELELGRSNVDSAKDYFHQSLKIREEKGFEFAASWSFHNLGKTYRLKGNYEEAQKYLIKSITIRTKYENSLEAIRSKLELAKVYFVTNQKSKALELFEECIKQLEQKGNLQLLTQAYHGLQTLYRDQKEYQKALFFFDKLVNTNTLMTERKSNVALSHYLAKVEVNIKEMDNMALRKENELSLQEVKSKQQQLFIIVFLALVIFIIVLIFVKSLSKKNRKLRSTIQTLAKTRIELIEAEKMSAMTTLVSGMAHQLNTPVGILITANSVIKDRLFKLNNKISNRTLNQTYLINTLSEIGEAVGLLESNGQKTVNLIQQFKRISAELEDAEISQFLLKPFLKSKLNLIASKYDNIKECHVIGDDISVEHYANVLRRVLEQLVKNTSENAKNEQSDLKVNLVIALSGNQLNLVYSDNGTGIADDIRDKVFDPFFTTKGMQKSMGLGLNIAYNSVLNLMKGNISCIESEEGAKFMLQLPLTVKAAQ